MIQKNDGMEEAVADESTAPVDDVGRVETLSEDDGGVHEGSVPIRSVIEAVLFSTDSPLPAARIGKIAGGLSAGDVKGHIAALNEHYDEHGASFRIEEIAKGYQMLTLPEYNEWLSKLFKARGEFKVTGAAMEALAVVAYRQPVMRAEIEEIRGVGCGEVLQRLREMNLVKIAGRADVIGRPLLYGTTKKFLEVFGLASLDELPAIEALKERGTKGSAEGTEGQRDEGIEGEDGTEAAGDQVNKVEG